MPWKRFGRNSLILEKRCRYIKQDSAASGSHSLIVRPCSRFQSLLGLLGVGLIACASCADMHSKPDEPAAPQTFYTVTAR